MLKDFTFWITDHQRVHFPGVSFGYGDSDPRLVALDKHYLVMRKPGTHEWSSRGTTGYYGAEWSLIEYVKIHSERFKVVRVLEERRPGRAWRKAKAELIERMLRLETKREASRCQT